MIGTKSFLNFLIVYLFFFTSLSAYDEGINVRFVKKYQEVTAGQEVSIQVYLSNQSTKPRLIVNHLVLPSGWEAIPANDILIHLMPNQMIVQNFVIKVPENQLPGEMPFFLEVRARDNPNIFNKAKTTFLVKTCSQESIPFARKVYPKEEVYDFSDEDTNESDCLTLTSSKESSVIPGETFFVSCLLRNNENISFEDIITLDIPEGWQVVPHNEIPLQIPPQKSQVHVFGVKVPFGQIAGHYLLSIKLKNRQQALKRMSVLVKSEKGFRMEVDNMNQCYPINEPIDLKLDFFNSGNAPISVLIGAYPDPCCKLFYENDPIEIDPHSSSSRRIRIEPDLGPDDDKQFVRVVVMDAETKEIIFQNTITLLFNEPYGDDEDPYVRIASHVSMMALGDNGRKVLALEWAGSGFIDPERCRYLDFVFRIPTTTKNVILGVDQRLYLSLSEPGWIINLGDTVYDVSPLTQYYRYGRGAGFDIDNGQIATGLHYTQNTYNTDYNPRETGAYLGYYLADGLYVSGNYLHREVPIAEPTSDIFSIYSEYDWSLYGTKNMHTELEGANDFVKDPGKRDTGAYRIETRGEVCRDTWFDFEKIYAGSAYYGYYSHVDMYTGSLDLPVYNQMRANASMTRLKQNFEDEEFNNYKGNDWQATKPRQRQYNANLSYNFCNGASITWNGLLFRAKDAGYAYQYNFLQKWAGFTSSFCANGWSVVGIVAWGRQDDYRKHIDNQFLQRYYCYLSKQFNEKYFGTLFYEGGNTNYYDAKPWRTTYGGSLGYRYRASTYAEIFLQRVNNARDRFQLNQASFRLCHSFSNYHSLDATVQYFQYKKHYPNDFLFLVSYTIPFGMPVAKRKDIGDVTGTIFNTADHSYVADALVKLGSKQCYSDDRGRFEFKNMKRGSYDLKTEILPRDIIVQNPRSQPVEVFGGQSVDVMLPVINSGIIRGEIIRYSYVDPQQQDESNMKKHPLPGARVIISLNHGEEVYTLLTNEKGIFNFNHLRPGEWLVKVVESHIPDRHHLSLNQIVVHLKAKEEHEVLFKVIPEKRVLQHLD